MPELILSLNERKSSIGQDGCAASKTIAQAEPIGETAWTVERVCERGIFFRPRVRIDGLVLRVCALFTKYLR